MIKKSKKIYSKEELFDKKTIEMIELLISKNVKEAFWERKPQNSSNN